MIKFAIVDDEPIAHRIIDGFAGQMERLQKVGNCYNAFEAIALINSHKVDVLFLDINMPKLSGFELLNTLNNPPKIIVTSAHKEFALEGYEFDVVDYLLKPFSLERFVRAVNKVSSDTNKHITHIAVENNEEHLFVKADKKLYRVLLREIRYIEAARNYCKVYLKDSTLKTLKKISDFEDLLPESFIRVHHSFIVAKNQVRIIDGNKLIIDSTTIPIGQTYRNSVASAFQP